MALERLNPAGLPPARGYSQVVVARVARTIYVAGQVALDAAGNLVGRGDVVAQARQVFRNLGIALAAAGASPASVTKMTWYIVGYREEWRAALVETRRELFGDAGPASTLIGVAALATPDLLVEVEAVAVVD
jgi:enamine deaminase RidA (YjgF/YER057c/UK114 family)